MVNSRSFQTQFINSSLLELHTILSPYPQTFSSSTLVVLAGIMAIISSSRGTVLLVICILLLVLPSPAAAFGAGNIPSISLVEGVNWRHGGRCSIILVLQLLTRPDVEDMLKTVAFLKGHKWSTMMIKRVYFGNWLRGANVNHLEF
jgi:hypothetical protein